MAAHIDRKAFETFRALAALQGYLTGYSVEGWIILRRFDVSAVFDTIDDATRWLDAQAAGVAQ